MADEPNPYGNPHLSWQEVTADTLLSRGPVLFGGLLLTADSGLTADVAIFDGLNASGRSFHTFRNASGDALLVFFPVPFLFQFGLFVDVGANVDNVTVFYSPLPSAPPPALEVQP